MVSINLGACVFQALESGGFIGSINTQNIQNLQEVKISLERSCSTRDHIAYLVMASMGVTD